MEFSALVHNLGYRAGPTWVWLVVYVLDLVLAVFCVALPMAAKTVRRDKSRASRFLSAVFTWCMAAHFAIIPISAVFQLWQVRFAGVLTLFFIFCLCFTRIWSLRKEQRDGA